MSEPLHNDPMIEEGEGKRFVNESGEELEELKKKRNELVGAISEMDSDASKVEIYEMHGEINEIDRKIHAIDPSQV